ncbi:MAG TPA: GAF domain-containing protein, partial [Thermomicrobiaceae bacterium]|nr:GAF domain-containing protein [Thermomicrobiaceae bacterium]
MEKIPARATESVARHPAGITAGDILDSALDAIIAIDAEGTVREWNRSAEQLFGYRRGEALGHELAELIIPPELRARYRAGLAQFRRSGEGSVLRQRLEVPAIRAGGGRFPVELTVTHLATDQGPIFIGSLHDVSGRRQAERRLGAQYTVNRILADAATLEGAMDAIIRALCAALDWDAGVIWSTDDGAQVLRCLALWHEPAHPLAAFLGLSRQTTFAPGFGLPGRVWASRAPQWIHNIEEDDNFPRGAAARSEGLHGALGFPLVSRGVVLGVAEFFSREIRPLDAEMLATLGTLGSQIGQFVERKQTEQALSGIQRELSERLAEINRLHAVSASLALSEDLRPLFGEVLAAVVALQDADMGVLMLYDPARDDLYTVASTGFSADYLAQVGRVPRGAGACGVALAERRPVVMGDIAREPSFAPYLAAAALAGYRAVYSAPLLTLGGDVVGTLATYFRTPHAPARRERSLAELYAHQAAELVETSRLYREADRTVRDREEFLSTAAHELKTPLTTVKGYSQLLRQQVQRDALDQPRLTMLVEHLEQQVSRMELLVADLLDISRIQQGHLVLRPEEVDLSALAHDVLERFIEAP